MFINKWFFKYLGCRRLCFFTEAKIHPLFSSYTLLKKMKRIDQTEKVYLYDQKIRQGKSSKEARLQIERDEKQVRKLSEKNKIKKARFKKDPKEINKLFKEGIGNLR